MSICRKHIHHKVSKSWILRVGGFIDCSTLFTVEGRPFSMPSIANSTSPPCPSGNPMPYHPSLYCSSSMLSLRFASSLLEVSPNTFSSSDLVCPNQSNAHQSKNAYLNAPESQNPTQLPSLLEQVEVHGLTLEPGHDANTLGSSARAKVRTVGSCWRARSKI